MGNDLHKPATRGDSDLVPRPQYTHPYVLLLLGHRLFFIAVRHRAGYKNARDDIHEILKDRNKANPEGTSAYDVFGDSDLLVRIWLRPDDLRELIGRMQKLDTPPAQIDVYRINFMSTPEQRLFDSDLEAPLLPSRAVKRKDGAWDVNRALVDPIGRDDTSRLIKFFVFFWCENNHHAARIAHHILRSCAKVHGATVESGQHPDFAHYSVYSFDGEDTHGCILTGYTRNWQEMQPAFFEVISSAEVSALNSTTMIRAGLSDLEDDRPSPASLNRETVQNYAALRLQAISTILDLGEVVADRETRDQFVAVFSRVRAGNAIVAYDPHYWWDYVAELRTLCSNIANHHNRRFIAFLMLAYTRMEKALRDLVIQCFPRRDPDVPDVRRQAYSILHECGIIEYDRIRQQVKDALRAYARLTGVQGLPKEISSAVKKALHDSRKCFDELAQRDAQITLGVIPRIVQKLRTLSRLEPTAWEFLDHPFMNGWKEDLESAFADRNVLMHGEILDIYQASSDGGAAWQQLLESYILAYPRVQWLIRHLTRNAERLRETEDGDIGSIGNQ